jgi:hypothetical protein
VTQVAIYAMCIAGGIVQNCPMAKVIRPVWPVSVSVPRDAQLWDVEGIPVAVIPVQGGVARKADVQEALGLDG